MSFKLINVGIADIGIAKPPDILRTILGSCVGVCLYDSRSQIGGLSHVMLPKMIETSSATLPNLKKYADTAIPYLLKKMENIGANRKYISAKIIGGATMFKIMSNNPASNIGQNNIDSVKQILKELKISIIAEDLGGDHGRTIDFYMESGDVKIKFSTRDLRVI
ncbi:MAG: chemotaxis protein CheD [Spirochaetes bacterium]|nr:chemotaxis protein CheD [Spirochaetota bacterium]